MEIKTKLYVVNSAGEKFMGIGVLWLLKEIEKQGSLLSAAKELGISYSKAYAMIQKLEKELSVDVIERKKGGAEHIGSSLTPFGENFLILYDSFQNSAKDLLLSPFIQFSDKVENLIEEFGSNEKE
ncbi:MAG: LysR family transcriptional regulator [Spirochaetia bacterium]|nr:LysR family transcriptional regulator [Spirochaetia bacterium]